MLISQEEVREINSKFDSVHSQELEGIVNRLEAKGFETQKIIQSLIDFQVAIPSWALGAGGTRFGRFSFGGEPRSVDEKLADIHVLHLLSASAGAVSLHIPWDIPNDIDALKERAEEFGIAFDAVNSNTFQDQDGQDFSYKFGSLSHEDHEVRQQAIEHNMRVIDIGDALGSKSITVWLADGASFPGQMHFRRALHNAQASLKAIYDHLPDDWRMFIEYKPYEPNFYATVIQDWGTSHHLAQECGPKAYSLVDLGHHLPNTNIEQIVATLLHLGKLGGFHFNDSKYGDDDLTVGSMKPYQLFLIFNELVDGMKYVKGAADLAWMIDASHNLKDPLEDLLQSLDAILIAYCKALLIDRDSLDEAQRANDVTRCQDILQDAFLCDVRPLVRESRKRAGGALFPLATYRDLDIRQQLIAARGSKSVATGL